MIFWSCMTAALVGWLLIGALVVAVLYAPHWIVVLIALAVAWVLTMPNVGGRRR
jgi:hypothetical protein